VTEAVTLGAYAAAILLGSLGGGALPLLGGMRRSDALLSFSAGVMLGAGFLHMLPEAVEGAGYRAIPFVLVGFLFLFLLERFALVHVCAEPGPIAGDPGHGPYYRLTRKVDGKTVTETFVSSASLAKAQREVAEYHRFRELSGQLLEVNERICGLRPVAEEAPSAEEKKRRKRSARKLRGK